MLAKIKLFPRYMLPDDKRKLKDMMALGRLALWELPSAQKTYIRPREEQEED